MLFNYAEKSDVPIHCTLPTAPNNDTLAPIATGNVLDGRPGSVIRWSCPDGSRLVGKRKTTCLHTGEWSHERPTCMQGLYAVHLDVFQYPTKLINMRNFLIHSKV